MKKILVFVLIALVGIALGVGGTVGAQLFFFKKTNTVAKAAPKKDGPVVSVGDMTVNLNGGFLKVNIDLEATDAKAATDIKNKLSFIQDRINTVLYNRPIQDVQTADGLAKLKQDLLTQLNQVTNNEIRDVLFISIVYQEG